MEKIDRLLKALDAFIKEEDDDITEVVPEFPGLETIPKRLEDYEKKIAKLLRQQKKYYVNGIESFIGKDNDITLSALLNYVTNNLFAADEFQTEMAEVTLEFLQLTIEELVSEMMSSIDKDVMFEVLSGRTLKWIEAWAEELAEIMQLSTHKHIQNVLTEVLENGEGIDKAIEKLKDLPDFNRHRARMTAQTEILTASSQSQWEAYQQSPAVTGKTWKHSGTHKNDPRPHHQELDGVTVGLDEKFEIKAPKGTYYADYPRDPDLPAGERVFCHCVLGPSVDENILGLSKEEKEELRKEALEGLAS